jgi:hypothetical protein
LSVTELKKPSRKLKLLASGRERWARLKEAHKHFNDISQWQRLTIKGRFNVDMGLPAVVRWLATVAGFADGKVLLWRLNLQCLASFGGVRATTIDI